MNHVSLNLHDHVRLTLIDASPADVGIVKQATGALEEIANGEGDIEIRFVENTKGQLPIEIDLPDAAWQTQQFRVAYPSGLRRLPLLRSLLNLKSAAKGLLGIHGTSFTHRDRGYLVCGSSGGGKTGTLLAYLLQGAQYLAAEWGYLSDEGQVLHGVPETLRLRDWHVQNADDRLVNVGLGDRLHMAKWRYAARGLQPLCQLLESVSAKQSDRLRHFVDRVDRQRYIDRRIDNWLGEPISPRSATLQTILLVSTHTSTDIDVRQLSKDDAVRRLTELQDADTADLLYTNHIEAIHRQPSSGLLDEFYARRAQLIDQLVEGKNVYSVARPQDVNLNELFEAIESVMEEVCLPSH